MISDRYISVFLAIKKSVFSDKYEVIVAMKFYFLWYSFFLYSKG